MVDTIRTFLSIAVVMFGLHALSCVYAVSTNGWSQARTTTTGAEMRSRLAPFFICQGTVGTVTITCSDYKAFEYIEGDCKVSEGKNKEYIQLVRAFVILPGALSAIGGAIALGGMSLSTMKVSVRVAPALILAVLALLCNGAGIAVTITSFESILCGKGPCRGATNCKESWEGSALLYFCSIVFPLVAAAMLVVALVKPSSAKVSSGKTATAARMGAYDTYPQHNNQSTAHHQQQYASSPAPRDIRSPGKEEPYASSPNDYSVVEQQPQGPVHPEGFELPEGDWEWDPASNMYWSESQYLFLNPQNSHFYDPNSSMWYNAETEEWYNEGEQ